MAPSDGLEEPERALRDAIEDLIRESQISSKQRGIKITGRINSVTSKCHTSGLSADLLVSLIDIITLPNELDQASVNSLIRNLYPAAKVNDDCILRVVSALGVGQGKVSFPAQANLLRWIVMVYHVLENPGILSQLYSCLFNLLDIIAIRAPLCHLLSLITRRRHVRPFRVQALLELVRKVGNEPQLIGLIRVYKDYYPDVIVGAATAGRAAVFKHPNPEFAERLAEIQLEHAQRSQDRLQKSNQSFKVVRKGVNGVKRGKVVPEVHTSRAQESSITLEEIENVNSFIDKLEKIDLPNHLVAVLSDPLLQKLVHLKRNKVIEQRIHFWLVAFFDDQLANMSDSIQEVLEMLQAMIDYVKVTRIIPQPCLRFMEQLLSIWDGVTGRNTVIELLSYLPLGAYDDLRASIWGPLEQALLDGSSEAQVALLHYYTLMVGNWTYLLLASPPPAHTTNTFSTLMSHINLLAHTILENSTTIQAQAAVLTWYETVSALHNHASLQAHVRIVTPPFSLIYLLHFSSSLSTLSRLCAILAIYKRAFEVAMSAHNNKTTSSASASTPAIEAYPKDYVNSFNGFLMDICNCLWRNRAFNTTDTNALGCLLPAALSPRLASYVTSLNHGLTLPSLFSLSYSPLLSYQSISCLRAMEDEADENGTLTTRHKGPVTQLSLKALARDGGLDVSWPDYRLAVLRYLEGKGVTGVGDLMYNTMKHLMQSRVNSITK